MDTNTIFDGSQKQIEFIESYFADKGKECKVYTSIENYTEEYLNVFFYDLNGESEDNIHSISLNNYLFITLNEIIKEFENFYNDNY